MQIAAGVIQTVPIWEFLEVTAEPAVVEGAHKLENPLCTTLFCYWRATDRQMSISTRSTSTSFVWFVFEFVINLA